MICGEPAHIQFVPGSSCQSSHKDKLTTFRLGRKLKTPIIPTFAHRRLPHHFTASGLVIAGNHVLLVHHNRIGAWVPPGGHIEDCELPGETVVREILEETGVTVEVVSSPLPHSGDSDAFFLDAPIYLQCVIAKEKGQEFYHLDLCYLCRPVNWNSVADGPASLPPVCASEEIKEARWVPLDRVDELPLAKNVKSALDFFSESSRHSANL